MMDDLLHVSEEEATGIRRMVLLSRNDKRQTWDSRMVDGRLEAIEPAIELNIDPVPAGPSRDKLAREMAASGRTRPEIAKELRVSVRTVQRYLE